MIEFNEWEHARMYSALWEGNFSNLPEKSTEHIFCQTCWRNVSVGHLLAGEFKDMNVEI